MPPPEPFAFERVRQDHFPLLLRWFSAPHVRRWWGPPEEELALVEADLDGGRFAMWIASQGGVPFAYVQDGDPDEFEESFDIDPPPGARAVDLLIGAPSHLGRGHAAPLLRAFAGHAAARGASALLLDPDAANDRALAAYARAGFEEIARHRDGPAETVAMSLPFALETRP